MKIINPFTLTFIFVIKNVRGWDIQKIVLHHNIGYNNYPLAILCHVVYATLGETQPLTVGLGIFGAPESGVDWSIITAATLMSLAPLLIAFLLFQRQFVQSCMHAGNK